MKPSHNYIHLIINREVRLSPEAVEVNYIIDENLLHFILSNAILYYLHIPIPHNNIS